MRFASIRWTEWSEDHITARDIDLGDVEDVVLHPPRYVVGGRDSTTRIYGTTRERRHLMVVVVEEGGGEVFVVTAREMTDSERRTFRRKGG